MGRALAGFLIGFSLATALAFGFIYVNLAPLQQDIQNAIPYVQTAYDTTHSSIYATAESVLTSVNKLASQAAIIPGIGALASQVVSGTGAISQIMNTARSLAEKTLPILQTLLTLIQVSLWAIIASAIGIIAGFFLLSKSSISESQEADAMPVKAAGKATWTCLKCGSHNSKEDAFCGECGEKLGKK